ncbi:MAG: hypothetical protein SGBAC_000289 [Bacillariaceae sp.]
MSNTPEFSVPSQIGKDGDGSFLNSSCPYANAIHESEVSSSLPGLVELRQCPVFSKECPFKAASSPRAFTEQLKRIPVGHMAKDGPLYKSLKFFHETKQNPSSKCPVREHVSVPEEWSFHQMVEELSLVSIMAEMALAIEQEESVSRDSEGNIATSSDTDDSSTVSPIPSEVKNSCKYPSRPSLSDALKTGTASAHQAAEGVQFVKKFVRGKIDRELYGLMIAQLYHLYGSLETALDRHAPAHFGSCHFPNELNRRSALQEDVEFWHSHTPKTSLATQDYIDRIQYLSANRPLLLLAHAYTRYLGDLSGGKVLARVAKKALHLDDDGLAFYQFPGVESLKLFKDKYRAALDDLSLEKDQIHELVVEANVAFLLNMRLFEELDVVGSVPGSSIRPIDQVYEMQYSSMETEVHPTASTVDKCPFIAKQKNGKEKEIIKCPWPFTVFHDRQAFMQSWQTWFVLGLLLLSLYSSMISA